MDIPLARTYMAHTVLCWGHGSIAVVTYAMIGDMVRIGMIDKWYVTPVTAGDFALAPPYAHVVSPPSGVTRC